MIVQKIIPEKYKKIRQKYVNIISDLNIPENNHQEYEKNHDYFNLYREVLL